ncbi:hypothetical protein GCM10007159_15470 [Modicisalibacter luteus]|nr:hypothetical protein GCM10007159_15470 [Halomonas lutea]
MIIVTIKPPGSLPGMMSLATIPAIRPKMIQAKKPMVSPYIEGWCATMSMAGMSGIGQGDSSFPPLTANRYNDMNMHTDAD